MLLSEVQYITFNDIDFFKKVWSGNPAFAKGKGTNRVVMPLNGRPVFYKEVTLEERFEELKNHFMLPESAYKICAFGFAMALGFISLIV